MCGKRRSLFEKWCWHVEFCKITNRAQLTAVAVTSVSAQKNSLVFSWLVIIAMLHLISSLARLPWLTYYPDFCSVSLEDIPLPRLPGFSYLRKDPRRVFRPVPTVWFAVLHHYDSKFLDLQFVVPLLSCPGESSDLIYVLLVEFSALTLFSVPSNMAHAKEKTPVCLVNEFARFSKIQPDYKLLSEQGPAHCKVNNVHTACAFLTPQECVLFYTVASGALIQNTYFQTAVSKS